MVFLRLFLIFLGFALPLYAEEDEDEEEICEEDDSYYCANAEPCSDLFRDLAVLRASECRYYDAPPIIYNHYGQVGYFQMPSARMGHDGTIILGASKVPPYYNFFVGFQAFSRLELAGAYRIFQGVQDPNLSPYGFGDYADKGINVKLNILKPEDTEYCLPGIAFGWDDCMGSKLFQSKYVVATQEWPKMHLEGTLGWSYGRIRGFFGGVAFSPWRKWCDSWLQGFTFVGEYDAVNYPNPFAEPHPGGRDQKTPVNVGLKYSPNKYWQFSASCVRGKALALSAQGIFDFGTMQGLFPKIKDPLCYYAPMDVEPIGPYRPKKYMIEDLAYALDIQGFTLLRATLEPGCGPYPTLRLRVANQKWLYEPTVHKRLGCVLANLTPSNISEVIVVVSNDSVLCQEYRFPRQALYLYATHVMTDVELMLVSPMREVTFPKCCPEILFNREEKALNWGIRPRASTFFGSSSGKFKYEIDGAGVVEGFIWYDVYYKLLLSRKISTSADSLGDFDMLNPSPLPNVNSDRIRYYQAQDLRFEQVYLQRAWSMGCGFHSRLGLGFFDIAYGGVVGEALLYPAGANWAVGASGAILWKRNYNDWGFTHTLRKFVGTGNTATPDYFHYSYLSQYFLDFYYRFNTMPIGLHFAGGQFLAGDFGVRGELYRFFPSGLRVFIWGTMTNGHDVVNGTTYYDRGIGFSMPLDILFKESSKARWGYAMSAWLRDVGYRAPTGQELYWTIFNERDYPVCFDCCR